jgi:DNA-binding CsgD family transcriptional regulator
MTKRIRTHDAPALPKTAEAIESFSRRIELLITERRTEQGDGAKAIQREDCWIVPIAVLSGNPADGDPNANALLSPERKSLLKLLEVCLASSGDASASASEPRAEPSAAAAVPTDSRLTRREKQILDHVLAGHPNKVTAYELMISRRTVEHHRAAMMRKTGARSVPELFRIVRQDRMAGS